MTDIPLGFADSRIYQKDGELCYDMWPAFGTQMTLPLRGAISDAKVIRNADDELVVAKGVFRYSFKFSCRKAGLHKLKYSASFLGIIPFGTHWGDISSHGKRALCDAYASQGQ